MLQPGDTFGDYRVLKLLGKGGMGAVFLLENAGGARIAAKILDPETAGDHEARKRFLREAQLALGVKHPNLVETYDIGEDPETGFCYILMEYVSGGSLADRIKAGPLPINDAIRVVYQIASVLEFARGKGIVHRDIKPGNIMFGADGKAKLADLGIARGGIGGRDTTTVTQTGMMIGTPAYMAPEQMLDAHHVDCRADIYSLGIVFYEMLTGERPNKDDTVVQLMARAVKGEPLPDVRTLRPEVSASLAQLLNMMVAPDKDGRISTPGQITSALDIIARGGTFAAKPVVIADGRTRAQTAPQTSRDNKSLPWKTLVPIGLIAGLAAAFGILAPKREKVVQSVVTTNVVERLVEKTSVVTSVVNRADDVPMKKAERAKDGKFTCKGPEGEWSYRVRAGKAWLGGDGKHALYPQPAGRLRLPSSLNGVPIAGIASRAFYGCPELREVEVPEGYETIGRDAFGRCESLEYVKLPSTMAFIDEFAVCNTKIRSLDLNRTSEWNWNTIAGTPCLDEIRFDSRNNQFVVADGLVLSKDRKRLLFVPRGRKEPVVPPTVDFVQGHAFSRGSVRSLVIPDTVREINMFAASRCDHLRRLVIGRGVRRIGKKAFEYSTNLVDLVIEEGIQRLDEWAVFSHCLSLRELVLPDSLETMGAGTFEDATSLERIHFGRSLRRLGYRSFAGAASLRSVAMPPSLRVMCAECFKDCHTLRHVLFEGDAPTLVDNDGGQRGVDIFMGTPRDLVVHVRRGSKGWNPDGNGLPKRWPVGAGVHARTIRYADDGVGPDADKKTFDPERLRDPDSTRAVQKALDAVFPGWKVSAVEQQGADAATWTVGYQPSWRGEKDVVTTMPPNMETPTVISRRIEVGEGHPVLNLEVASQNVDVDFLLSVQVNGKTALEPRLICTPEDSPYARIQVPLSAYKGRKALIEIVHAANNWFYEHAFWRKIEIVDGTGKERAGIIGVRRIGVFPPANSADARWLCRTPWRYTEKDPGDSWKEPSFDDSRWRKSARAFGRDAGSKMSVAERWQGERIWLRRSFSWNASEPVYNAVFNLSFDQDVEIFLNGTPVLKRDGWNTGWDLHAADRAAFARALRLGENVLAVTVNGDGPSFFDCGLVVETLDREVQDAKMPCLDKGPRRTEEEILKEPVFDAAKFADGDSTQRVQKTLDALFPGWKTSAQMADRTPGFVGEHHGLRNVLRTHPPQVGVPVSLSRRVDVPTKCPVLHLRLASHGEGREFRLRVNVNGKRVREKDIRGGWTDVFIDLGAWAGKSVKIDLEHMPTGWCQEWAYWSVIEIVSNVDFRQEARRQSTEQVVRLYDHYQLEGKDQNRAVQKTLDVLFPGWKATENDHVGIVGYEEEYWGRYNLLLTHPLREEVPAILSRRMKLPAKSPQLLLSVANHGDGDFELQVRVDGKVAHRQVIAGEGWKDLAIDLSPWAGKNVKIELVNMPNNWEQEWAHWGRIEIK